MKFLIVAPRFHTNLYYRVKALQDAGHKVKVTVLYQGKSEFHENIDIQTLKLSIFSRLFSIGINFFKKTYLKTSLEFRIETPGNELDKIFQVCQPDVVLLKAYQNLLAIKTLIVAKKHKAKVLMLTQTSYNHIKGSKSLFKLNMKLFRYLKVFAYITPIKINYDIFKKSGIKNVYYLPFVYPKVTEQVNFQDDNYIKIISVGKFVRRKEQLLLLQTISVLIDENFQIKLTLIGEIADKKYFEILNNYICKYNLSNIVSIKTNIDYDRMNQEYQKHDIFVLPSNAEPAAFSVVEAMANGLPIICSSENGTKCYVKEGINGYVFKVGNKVNLIKKIKLCTLSKEKTAKLSKNSLSFVAKYHNLESFEGEIVNIIKK